MTSLATTDLSPAAEHAIQAGAKKGIWTPPKTEYTWRDDDCQHHEGCTGFHGITDVEHVEFTAHHVVFWRDSKIALAVLATSVADLKQVVSEDQP